MADDFEQLSRSIVFSLLSEFPHWATLCGLHEHDDELPNVGPEVVAERWNNFRRTGDPLLAAATDQLSPDELTDREALQHTLDYMQFSLLHVERWKKDPDALGEIGRALCVQLWRDYAPFDVRIEQLASRLDKLPDYLTDVRQQILDPVGLWTEMAMATTAEMPAFYQSIAAATEHMVSPGVQERLERAVDRAAQATDAYHAWLTQEVQPQANGAWALGPDAFAELCHCRRLGLTPDELVALGQDMLERGREELLQLAVEVRPNGSVDDALSAVFAEYPRTMQAALEECGRAMRNAHRFLFKNPVMRLPEDDEVEFVQTPEFLAYQNPVTAYIPPGRFENLQHGTCLVTAPASAELMPAMLSASSIWNAVVRDTYPGRHLMATAGNRHASMLRMLPGLVGSAAETTDGWALYCQHVMVEEGFLPTSQRRLIQMRDHCHSAAKLLVDVGLHVGEMTLDRAEEFLAQEGHVPVEQARREVRHATLHPGRALSGLLGAYQLACMREDLQAPLGDAFDVMSYHDAILRAGPMPLSLVRECVERADLTAAGTEEPDA